MGIELLEFDWAGETARQVGTVVHRLLQHWGKTGIEDIGAEALRRGRQLGRKLLTGLGVPGDHLEAASAAIATALQNMLEDGRARWILSKRHTGARCELALSGVREGAVEHVIIDRSFVDEHGTRWIIDYKTGAHGGGGLDEFLDREQDRYRGQLERYAGIVRRMETGPIRLGLYFPLLRAWREWPFRDGDAAVGDSGQEPRPPGA